MFHSTTKAEIAAAGALMAESPASETLALHPSAVKLWSFSSAGHISTYQPFNTKTPLAVSNSVLTGLLFTFCEGRGLGCVRQAELALLPAAVVADQRVVGLLDVHIVANAEHVTGSLCRKHVHRKVHVRAIMANTAVVTQD